MKYLLYGFSILFSLAAHAQEHRPEIHSKHWIWGYPYGTPRTNDLIIRDIYAMSNNDSTKFADWVAYRLNRALINGATKSRYWKSDPWLASNETLEKTDYDSANIILGTDRGHQAPLASFDGAATWYETNYLSNITPQRSGLNRGAWAALEDKVRTMVNKLGVVYVMTGPLYERDMRSLPYADEPHVVPSGYWKIILVETDDDAIQSLAFIFDQNTLSTALLADHLVTIDEVEQRSHLDFLWLLEDDREEAMEATMNREWFEKNMF